jgi:glutathione S-transferase
LSELYDHILSDRCYAVRLMLSLVNATCERKIVDYVPSRTPACSTVLPLNPAGDIPVYVDGDLVLTDVVAILRHLSDKHDPDGRWCAGEPAVEHWLNFAMGPLAALHEAREVTLFGTAGDRDTLVRQGRAALRVIEDQLSDQALRGQRFIAFALPSLADIAIFPSVMLSHDCGIGHEDYPAINLWQRRMRRLDRFISMPGIPDYF